MVSQPFNIEPNESNVKQISKSNHKLVDKILQNNTVFVSFPAFVSLKFCQLFYNSSVDILIKAVGYYDVYYVWYLSPESFGVKNSACCCPARNSLRVEKFMIGVDKSTGIQRVNDENQCQHHH